MSRFVVNPEEDVEKDSISKARARTFNFCFARGWAES
jgi:hypothetical protein